MLQESFTFIRDEINKYLDSKSVPSDEQVTVSNIARISDDSVTYPNEKNIVLTLVNIEEDRISKSNENISKNGSKVFYKNPKIHLNLFCLFVANHNLPTNYIDALGRLTRIVQFFQQKFVFTPTNSPSLPGGIEKLIFSLYNINFEQINHLWSTIGGKYLPSVLYKMQLVVIDEDAVKAEGALITEIDLISKLK